MPLSVVCYNICQQKFPPNYLYQNGEWSELGTVGTVKFPLIFSLLLIIFSFFFLLLFVLLLFCVQKFE